jgi:hypothetical protein
MKNYIFLDIDGVLTSARLHVATRKRGVWSAFDPVAVAFLEKVVRAWPAEIIVSSTWRNLFDASQFQHLLGCSDLANFFHQVWKTPILGRARGLEVNAWLTEHGGKEYTYIILDDNSDFLPEQMSRLVQTDAENGMLAEHYTKILNMAQLTGRL